MKKTIPLILFLTSFQFAALAQSWETGFQALPFLYWYVNESDNIYKNYSGYTHIIDYPSSLRPNGWSAGIPIRYLSEGRWYIESGVHWSKQSQVYRSVALVQSIFDTGPLNFYESRLDYVNIPLIFGWRYPINYSSNFLFAGIGINTSILTKYKDVRVFRNENFQNTVEITKNILQQKFQYPTHEELFDPREIEPIYNRWMLGGILEAGINLSLNQQWSLLLAIHGNMDFTNVDSDSPQWFRKTRGYFSFLPEDDPIRRKSTQYRLGLSISVLCKIW